MTVDLDNSKVFIANFQPNKDFSPAEEFGELVFMSRGFIDLKNLARTRSKIEQYLKVAAPTDFIILNGPAVVNALIIALWFNRFGYVNVLSWDPNKTGYIHNVVGISPEDQGIYLTSDKIKSDKVKKE